MQIDLKYPEETAKCYAAQLEQTEYLAGVLWTDRAHRLDKDSSRNISAEIDPYGTCTKAFWRGVIEVAGRIYESPSGDYTYPQLELEGSYAFLLKFVDFLKEEMEREGMGMHWSETDRKLRFAASGGKLRLTGVRAQQAVRVLYLGAIVGRDSYRHRADSILQWTQKR